MDKAQWEGYMGSQRDKACDKGETGEGHCIPISSVRRIDLATRQTERRKWIHKP